MGLTLIIPLHKGKTISKLKLTVGFLYGEKAGKYIVFQTTGLVRLPKRHQRVFLYLIISRGVTIKRVIQKNNNMFEALKLAGLGFRNVGNPNLE